ncbi:alpha-L-fucosidase [Jiangella asiatica]|uniref:alpha-L-fucosidase n=1 Tax=Jiangella asiatica TaxID=2530372 RepID=A0A4R5DGV1_9ACTN|nr:alpha-L-fucosidase [Jiangella asiatica]TDE11150.1 hypothetical protein E1269_09760 [Jiangella asiatica]
MTGEMRPEQAQRPGARTHPSLPWFRLARFGMFVHWGLYALAAGRWRGTTVPGIGEWIMCHARIPATEYATLAARFDPKHFDPQAWVALAKRAGQRYVVLTAKHHDGFCLWHTKLTGYNTVDATPFGRDVVAEVADECRRQGMPFGVYYSQTQDWHHPDGDGNDWDYAEAGKDFDGYVEHYVKPQVRELLTGYGPLCVVWFDTPRRITRRQSQELVDLVHELQPGCLVNGRIGNGLGDYATATDNHLPDDVVDGDWETPVSINNTWGYRSDDHDWKSAAQLISTLAMAASRGGNVLLNVGPDGDGRIPEPSARRLDEVGRWLAEHPAGADGTDSATAVQRG